MDHDHEWVFNTRHSHLGKIELESPHSAFPAIRGGRVDSLVSIRRGDADSGAVIPNRDGLVTTNEVTTDLGQHFLAPAVHPDHADT